MKTPLIISSFLISAVSMATDFGVSSQQRIAQGNDMGFTSNIEVPMNDGFGDARDAVKLSDGTLVVYNGTFDPVLSVYTDGVWADLEFPGWSTVNNISYGGIASDDRYVWVTDMATGSGVDLLNGVVKFDLDGLESDVRFADGKSPIDLTLGQDGMLYVLYSFGSTIGRLVDVYNPNNNDLIKTINLESILGFTEHRSIAVDAQSNMYIADWDGDIQLVDNDGKTLASIDVGGNVYDVDLVDGQVIAGDRFGQIHIADLQLQGFTTLQITDLDPLFSASGVFILGDSVDTSLIEIDLIFMDDFD